MIGPAFDGISAPFGYRHFNSLFVLFNLFVMNPTQGAIPGDSGSDTQSVLYAVKQGLVSVPH